MPVGRHDGRYTMPLRRAYASSTSKTGLLRGRDAAATTPTHETGQNAGSSAAAGGRLLYTPSACKNLSKLVIALCSPGQQPILVEGPPGCGKTACLRELARLAGPCLRKRKEMAMAGRKGPAASDSTTRVSGGDRARYAGLVEVHLDDAMDIKSLLGTYVCTDVPGEFRWQPGALAQAVIQGRWVVIDDVDRAPFEVLSALVPLLETRRLLLPGRGEVIMAAPTFRLFATRSCRNSAGDVPGAAASLLRNVWSRVVLDPISDREREEIAFYRFSMLRPPHCHRGVVELMSASFWMLRCIFRGSQYGAATGDVAVAGVGGQAPHSERTHISPAREQMLCAAQAVAASTAMAMRNALYGRQTSEMHFSSRQFFKWCRRVVHMMKRRSIATITGVEPHRGRWFFMTEANKLRVLEEAFDCFCAAIPAVPRRLLVSAALCELWDVPRGLLAARALNATPRVEFLHDAVTVGRSTICLRESGAVTDNDQKAQTPPPQKAQAGGVRGMKGYGDGFAPTGVSLRVIERLGMCTELREPVLLVGETGTGKTACVQRLAQWCRRRLVVQNLHVQARNHPLPSYCATRLLTFGCFGFFFCVHAFWCRCRVTRLN